MDAPNYPPAAAFEQPISKPFVPQLANMSLAELMANPAAREIVFKHLPAFKMVTNSPMMKPHMGNMTVMSLEAFVKPTSPEVYTSIDEELGQLPPVGGSSP